MIGAEEQLGDLVVGWVEQYLRLQLTPWQQEYLRSFYEVTPPREG